MLNRQVFQSRIFTTFSINLEDYMLANQVMSLKDVLVCVERVSAVLLGYGPDADVVKLVHTIVGLAHGLAGVSTIVLVVRHWMV